VIRECRSRSFPKGTFKARTSKQGSFLNFLSSAACSRNAVRRNQARFETCFRGQAEDAYCCAQFLSATAECGKKSSLRSMNGQECPFPHSFLIFAGSSPVTCPARAFPDVEIIWKSCALRRLTGILAALYVCRVSRTAGFALVASPSRPEFAPLRRNAIRSLTTRLNVPVVRERIRAKAETISQDRPP